MVGHDDGNKSDKGRSISFWHSIICSVLWFVLVVDCLNSVPLPKSCSDSPLTWIRIRQSYWTVSASWCTLPTWSKCWTLPWTCSDQMMSCSLKLCWSLGTSMCDMESSPRSVSQRTDGRTMHTRIQAQRMIGFDSIAFGKMQHATRSLTERPSSCS